jgi:choline-sulfatase
MSSTARKPDILIFMSDQHTPYYSGFYGNNVDTPNLDRLCSEGTQFTECYTANPLCSPTRMAMLSEKRCAKSGIFFLSTLADTTPTFLHCLVEAGYETTLVGRMHFIGQDQYHGFINHIAGDMTPVTWNYKASRDTLRKERGVFVQTDTFSGKGATSVSGGGKSPVLNYDAHVIDVALDYLKQDHEKPQVIFVSIYGPHFPYVAPKDLYLKYLDRVQLSKSFDSEVCCSVLKPFQSNVTPEIAKSCMASYCGMIEQMDREFGKVRDAFEEFTKKRGTEKIIGYLSDHGDQCGDRRIYGKENFYEKSAKIPFIFAGDGIKCGKICKTPVSIMDIGPTLEELTGSANLNESDGISVVPALRGTEIAARPVISEFMYRLDGKPGFFPPDKNTRFSHGVMIRLGKYKYMTWSGFEDQDCLFNIEADPDEMNNLARDLPEELEKFRVLAEKEALHETALKNYMDQRRVVELMNKYELEKGNPDQSMMWKGNPPDAATYPEICVKNPVFFSKDGCHTNGIHEKEQKL